MKKLEIQVIMSMIIFTRTSERIFNPRRYARYLYSFVSINHMITEGNNGAIKH